MGKVSTVTAEQRIEPVTCVFYFAVGSLPDNLAALGIVKFLLLLLMCIMFVISLFLFSSFFSLPFFSLFSLPSFSSLLGAFFSFHHYGKKAKLPTYLRSLDEEK